MPELIARRANPCSCTASIGNYTRDMDQSERVHLHESCVVPYRRTARGVEFCLLSQVTANRWEFPKAETDGDGPSTDEVLEKTAMDAGLRGHLDSDDPLDAFLSSRGNESRSMTAYLMEVTGTDDEWPKQSTHRRLWCLAEEARARLRRKPLRRFIDCALRLVGQAGEESVARSVPIQSFLPRKPR